MKRIILVRHGQTRQNERRVYNGIGDESLDEMGERQARELAGVFRDTDISACFSSDLVRAKRTAELIVEGRGIPVVTDPRLREIDFGRWEGLSYEDIVREYPEESAKWFEDPVDAAPPEGESLRELKERVDRFLADVLSGRIPGKVAGRTAEDATGESVGMAAGKAKGIDPCEGSVLVVSHGGPIRVILCEALGIRLSDYWRVKIGNGGYAIAEFHADDTADGVEDDTNCTADGIEDDGTAEVPGGNICRQKGILCQLVNPGEV